MGSFWGDFGSFWGQSRDILLGDVFLASFLASFFGGRFGSFLSQFLPVFGPICVHFGHFYGHIIVLGGRYFFFLRGLIATLNKMMQGKAKICKVLPKFTKMMQEKEKICKILPKFIKMMEKCPQTCPISPIKHLFCLKKRPKSTFEPMNVCSKWLCLEVSWVDFECFYALL